MLLAVRDAQRRIMQHICIIHSNAFETRTRKSGRQISQGSNGTYNHTDGGLCYTNEVRESTDCSGRLTDLFLRLNAGVARGLDLLDEALVDLSSEP